MDSRLTSPHDLNHPADFKPQFASREQWERRAEFLRRQALVAQGLWPEPVKTPLNAVIHSAIDRDGYTIEKVFFASLPGHYVSGNLYRPKGRSGKLPTVLCPYGHWPDGRFIWRSDADLKKEIDSGAERDINAARSPLQANYAMLARMGCVVFQYDMVGYCDSTKIKHREGFLDAQAILHAQSFMGLQTWNSIRSLDFVLSLPEVDPARIAVTGSSSGGTQTIALCATDPRPAVAFPMVMVSMNMQGGCVCENAPLYRIGTNNIELASLFAPKPQGAAAANDWTHDFLSRGLPEMKSIWRLYGAEDDVWGVHVDYGHNHNLHSRLAQYAFLNKHLKLGCPEPIEEKPFEPVPPKELSVYDDQHPLPNDAADAEQLRKTMTAASDEQMRALQRRPEEYQRVVAAALKAMVVHEMPLKPEVVTDPAIDATPAGGEWSGFIGRSGSGERVPCKLIVPPKWSGRVVLCAAPAGCSGLTGRGSEKPLLDNGAAVMTVDPFMSGEFVGPPHSSTAPASTKPTVNPPYAGYTLCYERSVLANRVHDLLTAVAVARSLTGAKTVDLIGIGSAGPAALLARALAGDAIQRAAIDLTGFDFDQVRDEHDPMLLPGALKYGGIYGFVPLCADRATLLCSARETGSFALAARTPSIVIEKDARDPGALVEWLLGQK